MSVKTGIHRIAQFVRGMGVLAASGFLVLGVSETRGSVGDLKTLLFAVLAGAVACALLWAVAWVIDGFVRE